MPVAARQRRLFTGAIVGTALIATCSQVYANFRIEHSPEPTKPNAKTYNQTASPAFDPSNYVVWVDNQYSAVMEYGAPQQDFSPAPSYGDPMKLSDALGLLVPAKWRVLRDKSLSGDLTASWSVASGSWVDVLRNLGERHGLQFHIDHNRSTVFVKEGRKLLNESETELASNRKAPPKAEAAAPVAPAEASDPIPSYLSYDVIKGQSGESVISELGMMLGYETAYWMTSDRVIKEKRRFHGSPMTVFNEIAAHLNVKTCLYDADSVVATVRRNGECPQ